ncbi:MAG: hypothetical protein FWE11_04580 [Defluviitaleaceae bacterium]|nr:hypothetical protein [Defluviitaleaceae bacterium]
MSIEKIPKKRIRKRTKRRANLLAILFILIGISILGLIIWGASRLLRTAWFWIQELVSTVSTMDTVIIIALISGTVTVLGLIINSVISLKIKNSDIRYKRKIMQQKKLEAPYSQFVNMLFAMIQKKEDAEKLDDEVRNKLIRDMSREILLYGSDRVVLKWVSYRKKADKFTLQEHLLYIESILHLIREDLGIKKGSLNEGDLLALFVDDFERFADNDVVISLGGLKFSYSADKDEDVVGSSDDIN